MSDSTSSAAKLRTLMDIEGFDDSLALAEATAMDSVCPAICMNEGCDYTSEMEPDQTQGFCEECRTGSMKSALVLMGFI
jgi:hypothetical protein